MDLFPENIYTSYPLKVSEKWKTIKSEMTDGTEHRSKKWAFPKRIISLSYKNIKHSEIESIWEFYQKQNGAFKTFGFFYPTNKKWWNEYITIGDGSTTTFDLKSKNTTNETVYIDGVSTTDYTIERGTGINGVDKIIFTSIPSDGSIITYDFEGNLYLKVRFVQDNLDYNMMYYLIYNMELSLFEVEK